MKTFISFLVLYLNGKSIHAVNDFMMAAGVFLLISGTLGLLTQTMLKIFLVHINQEPIYFSTSLMKNIRYEKQDAR
ncbi:hypothetical protein V1477_021145 [Vespula maculifrons]|uniref:Uncharacterized protein n=1 Tax=Vespula maculifrons TaxID=7453 RepID=A0ABD2AH99_VESMC